MKDLWCRSPVSLAAERVPLGSPSAEVGALMRSLQRRPANGPRGASLLDRPAPHLFELVMARQQALVPVRSGPSAEVFTTPLAPLPQARTLRVQKFLLVGHSRVLNEAEAARQPTVEVTIPFLAQVGTQIEVGLVKELLGLQRQQVLRGARGAWDVLRDTDTIDLTDMTVEYRAARTAWAS